MALDTRLDLTGLSHLWDKIKALVPAKSKKTQGIFYGEIDSTSTATVMTATVDGITELADGVAVLLKNGVITSASGWTLNINDLGAKPVYSSMAQATRITTAYNINYTWLFVYDSDRVSGGCWIAYYGYYSDANTIGYIIRTNNSSLPLSSALGRYRLMFTSADGTHYVPATANTSTSATANKPVTQTPIDPFGRIVYYGYTSVKNAGEMAGVSYIFDQNAVTLGYSFAKGSALTMTAWKPVYLKCEPQSDGSAIIDTTTPWVQDLPTTEDGKIYIFLGIAYSATNIELMLHHPVYEYKNGAVRQWTNTSVREIPDASQEADGTALVAVDGEWTKQTGYGYTKLEDGVAWIGKCDDTYLSPIQVTGAYVVDPLTNAVFPLTAGDNYDIEVQGTKYSGLFAEQDTVSYQGFTFPVVYIGNGQLIGVSGGDQTCPFVFGYADLSNLGGDMANLTVLTEAVVPDQDANVYFNIYGDVPTVHQIQDKYINISAKRIRDALGYMPPSAYRVEWEPALGSNRFTTKATYSEIISARNTKLVYLTNNENCYLFSRSYMSGNGYFIEFVSVINEDITNVLKMSAPDMNSKLTWEQGTAFTSSYNQKCGGTARLTTSNLYTEITTTATSEAVVIPFASFSGNGNRLYVGQNYIRCRDDGSKNFIVSGTLTASVSGTTLESSNNYILRILKHTVGGTDTQLARAVYTRGMNEGKIYLNISPFYMTMGATEYMKMEIIPENPEGPIKIMHTDCWLTIHEL